MGEVHCIEEVESEEEGIEQEYDDSEDYPQCDYFAQSVEMQCELAEECWEEFPVGQPFLVQLCNPANVKKSEIGVNSCS